VEVLECGYRRQRDKKNGDIIQNPALPLRTGNGSHILPSPVKSDGKKNKNNNLVIEIVMQCIFVAIFCLEV